MGLTGCSRCQPRQSHGVSSLISCPQSDIACLKVVLKWMANLNYDSEGFTTSNWLSNQPNLEQIVVLWRLNPVGSGAARQPGEIWNQIVDADKSFTIGILGWRLERCRRTLAGQCLMI